MGSRPCSECGNPGADLRCSKCLGRWYWWRSCQASDWAGHKHKCPAMAHATYHRLMMGLCGELEPRVWCGNVMHCLSIPPHELLPPATWAEVNDFKIVVQGYREKDDLANELYALLVAINATRARCSATAISFRDAALTEIKDAVERDLGRGVNYGSVGFVMACACYGALLARMGRYQEAADFARTVRQPILEQGMDRVVLVAEFLQFNSHWVGDLACENWLPGDPSSVEAQSVAMEALRLIEAHRETRHMLPEQLWLTARAVKLRPDFVGALAYAKRALEVSHGEEYLQAADEVCNSLRQLMRGKEAEAVCEKALAYADRRNLGGSMRCIPLLMLKAGALLEADRAVEAVTVLERAFKIEQRHGKKMGTQAGLQLAMAYELAGQMDKALLLDAKLLKTRQSDPGCIFRVAIYRLAIGEKENAERLLRGWIPVLRRKGKPTTLTAELSTSINIRPLQLYREILEAKETQTPENIAEIASLNALEEKVKQVDEDYRVRCLEETREMIKRTRRERAAMTDEWVGGGGMRGSGGGGTRRRGRGKAKQTRSVKRDESRARLFEVGDHGAAGAGGEGGEVEGLLSDLCMNRTVGEGAEEICAGVEQKHEAVEVAPQADECPVCFLELLELKEDAVETLKCGHAYHEGCLCSWITNCRRNGIHPTCPLCREPIERMVHD